VPQLNEYLTRMTNVVFSHHGTLDKYIGDAVMAIFGAPLPQADHAEHACATALDMVENLRRLHEHWAEQGRPVWEIGIGINTGVVMVGNMGSEGRFDYTVLGDNVNLASRLEGLTKMYGVPIVVSESTWDAVKDKFVGRELDVVRVKGRQKPVAIYQVMGRAESRAEYQDPLGKYEEAVGQFRQGNWQAASDLFQEVEKWWPGDPPSRLYRERCKELLQNRPPAAAWSFVTTLDHK
jgi:adenylate cyclase